MAKKPWDKPPRMYSAELAGGKERPSVTEVLGIIDKSGPLVGWAVKECTTYLDVHRDGVLTALAAHAFGNTKPWESILKEARSAHRRKSDEAKDTGTRVHEIVHDIALGLPVNIGSEPQPVQNGVAAYRSWCAKHGLIIMEAERVVWSDDLDTAGTLDAVGLIGDRLALLDWKTSKAIYPEYEIQAAVYARCYEELERQQVASVWIVRLDKETGEPEFREVKNRDRHIEAFRAARVLWGWKREFA